jgi:hypothetical protein
MHAELLDARYTDRREAIDRKRRAPREIEAIVNNSLMSPEARNLLNHLLSLPTRFEINQRYVVGLGDYGGRDRVRRLFREMTLAGHCTADPERNPDGSFKRGIYLVSDEPRWLAPVDISEGSKTDEADQLAEGNTGDPATAHTSPGIDNSIVNPHTDTCPVNPKIPLAPPDRKAESRSRGSKAFVTNQAERRAGGASCLPEKEPGFRPAKGSAMRGVASGAGDQTAKDRYIERRVAQLVDVASFSGSRMPNPRKAAGVMASLIQWQMEGLDFELDVLPAVAEVCGRAGDPDKPIVSWRYFIGAIRDAYRRRTRTVAEPAKREAPRRQIESWTPAGVALNRRRS